MGKQNGESCSTIADFVRTRDQVLFLMAAQVARQAKLRVELAEKRRKEVEAARMRAYLFQLC